MKNLRQKYSIVLLFFFHNHVTSFPVKKAFLRKKKRSIWCFSLAHNKNVALLSTTLFGFFA